MINKRYNWIKKNWILGLSILLALLGLCLMIGFACHKSFNGGGELTPDLASHYGGFISGVVGSLFTLVGFLLLFQTILEQREQFKLQQFESQLFEMIKFHRDNVETTTYVTPYKKERTLIQGRGAFIEMKKQCVDIYNECCACKLLEDRVSKEKIDSTKRIKISYLLFVFGVSERTMNTTISQLKNLGGLSEREIRIVIYKVRKKKTKYNNKIVFYGGHQSKLGFYFRHIYGTVKFIDDSDFLTKEQKKEYVKLLRSQLTTYEQGLLFFNSISPLGEKWGDLVRDYELIKNIPPQFMSNVKVKGHYPEIDYEF